jgi:hypothetical protein
VVVAEAVEGRAVDAGNSTAKGRVGEDNNLKRRVAMKKSITIIILVLSLGIGTLLATGRGNDKEALLVGSIKSNKYHYSTCRCAKRIKVEYLIIFETPESAKRMGYSPCKICKPPTKTNNEYDNTLQVGRGNGKDY